MTTSIFIRSYRNDYPYLRYCLRSIAKFARGFHEVVLVVPQKDDGEVLRLIESDYQSSRIGHLEEQTSRLVTFPYSAWPDKGMLSAMHELFHAERYCHDADFICHVDSDCVFLEPVTPDDYFKDGKPVLPYASYDWLATQQANLRCWQRCTANALGYAPDNEFMRMHPAVHYRELYPRTRQRILDNVKQPLDDWMKTMSNNHPYGVTEFPVLGQIAWEEWHDEYHWINQEKEGLPKQKLFQAWSRQPITNENKALYERLGIL